MASSITPANANIIPLSLAIDTPMSVEINIYTCVNSYGISNCGWLVILPVYYFTNTLEMSLGEDLIN